MDRTFVSIVLVSLLGPLAYARALAAGRPALALACVLAWCAGVRVLRRDQGPEERAGTGGIDP